MFDKKGILYTVLFTTMFLIMVIGILFLIKSPLTESISTEVVQEEDENFDKTEFCFTDDDCNDNDGCTIEDCREGVCVNIDVLLCYNNDGCCPKNCNDKNDNDCF